MIMTSNEVNELVCINNSTFKNELTIGKPYKIEPCPIYKDSYLIVDDNGDKRSVKSARFKTKSAFDRTPTRTNPETKVTKVYSKDYRDIPLPKFNENIGHTYTYSVDELKEHVCKAYNMDVSVLSGDWRKKEIAVIRFVLMYMIKNKFKWTLNAIGRAFGGRDHATVINAMAQVQNVLDNPKVNKLIHNTWVEINSIVTLANNPEKKVMLMKKFDRTLFIEIPHEIKVIHTDFIFKNLCDSRLIVNFEGNLYLAKYV